MPRALSRDSVSTLKNLATSPDPRTSIVALQSLFEIFLSSPDTYPHLFDAVKFWLQRESSFAHITDTFAIQVDCVYVLAKVVKHPSPSVPWTGQRFVATKELWPVVSKWIQRLFQDIINIEGPATDDVHDVQHVEQVLHHVEELLRFLADPVTFDNPPLPNSRGYFRARISSPSFLTLILRLWVHTAAFTEYRDVFQNFSRLPLSLNDCYLMPQSQRHALSIEVFNTIPHRLMTSCVKSIIPFADDPLPSIQPVAVSFSFLDCASNLSPVFRRALLAGRSLYWTMVIIKTLLRGCASQIARKTCIPDNALNLLLSCLAHINTFLSTEGRRWVADALKMGIIDCLWKMDTLFHTFSLYTQRAFCITDILKMISIYAMHPTIYFRIQASIKRVIPEGWKSSVRWVAEAWNILQTEMSNMSPFMNAINKDVFRDCSLSTCGKAGARRACTGCREALYCSKQCQKSDWQNHRAMCSSSAEKFARAEPALPEGRGWELRVVEAMLLYEIKGRRKEWYAQLKQAFVARNPAYTLSDLGYIIDLSRVPRQVDILPLDTEDSKYHRLSREGHVIIKWRVPWAGLEEEKCMMWISSLDPSGYSV